jgi:hypothetical protein
MHEVIKNEKAYMVYDSIDEVVKITGYQPPLFCNKCGKPLKYFSLYDALDRFTIKASCKDCYEKWAIPMTEEKYEEKMLERWAERVKKRDGYTCRMPDANCKGELHSHHMIPKKMAPSKKYDVDNGICLCAYHHKLIHSFM